MEGLSVSLDPRVTVEAAVARDVRLDTHDGFDARVAAERVEVDRSVERAVIGERERGHPKRFRARYQVGETGQPVEQAVLAVRVKVDELFGDSPAPRVRSEEAPASVESSGARGSSLSPHGRAWRVTFTTSARWSDAAGAFTVRAFEAVTPMPQT